MGQFAHLFIQHVLSTYNVTSTIQNSGKTQMNKMWPCLQVSFFLVEGNERKQINAYAFFGAKEDVATRKSGYKALSTLDWGNQGRGEKELDERFSEGHELSLISPEIQQVAKGREGAKEEAWESMAAHDKRKRLWMTAASLKDRPLFKKCVPGWQLERRYT